MSHLNAQLRVVQTPARPPIALDPAAEAEHLRNLIETQPSCLIRAAVNGELLAINQAGLRLLGAAELGQALGRHLTDWIAAEQKMQWVEFLDRAWNNGPCSVECDLVGPGDTRRAVLFRGAALRQHPDGLESLLLTARDISSTRRLETDLENQGTQRMLTDLRNELEQLRIERQQLEESLRAQEASHQRLVSEQTAQRGLLQQAVAAEHQLAVDLKEQEGRRRIEELTAELDKLRGDRERLQARVSDQESDRQRLVAEHAAGREELDRLRARLNDQERDRQRLVAEHAAGREELARVTARLDDQEKEKHRIIAEHAAERDEAERALTHASTRSSKMAKTLADQRIELEIAVANAGKLEVLAAAGRSAVITAAELQKALAVIDGRTRKLLGQAAVDSPDRKDFEALRTEAAAAASLARQIAQVKAEV